MHSVNTSSYSSIMQMIAIVMLLIYILRNIVTINYSLASNSLKTVTLVIGFFITSAYFFSRSIREAQ